MNIESLTEKISAYINNLTSQIDNSTISNSRHYDLLNKTFEDSTIIDPKERETYYGQSDHVRQYGHRFS